MTKSSKRASTAAGAEARPKARVVRRQLINVLHHNKSMHDPDWFGRGQTVMAVERVWLDDGSSEKRLIKFNDPTVKFYITEGENSLERPALYVQKDICTEYEVPVENLVLECAKLTGQMDFYREAAGPGANRRRRKIHDHRDLHGSDVNVVDHYIDRYMEHFKDVLDTTSPLTHSFSDIEVDAVDYGGFPDEKIAPCPTNLISYFYQPTKTLYQFHNRDSVRENPLREQFEAEHEAMAHWLLAEVNRAPLEQQVKKIVNGEEVKIPPVVALDATPEQIHEALATEEGRRRQRCDRVVLVFCDDETGLYDAYFHQINEVDKPDVCAFWNMHFDALTMINRMLQLGLDPEDYFCPKEFHPHGMVDYQEDDFNTEPTDKGDTFTVAGWTMYVDQMLLYASLRKQAGKKESYGLDFTLRSEIKEGKTQYEGSIRDFPYRDYKRFSLYAANDVVPMSTLEQKTEDMALNYQLSMMTRTRFGKTMKKTICLRNFANIFYRNMGLVLSNNHNRNKERTAGDAKFRGA